MKLGQAYSPHLTIISRFLPWFLGETLGQYPEVRGTQGLCSRLEVAVGVLRKAHWQQESKSCFDLASCTCIQSCGLGVDEFFACLGKSVHARAEAESRAFRLSNGVVHQAHLHGRSCVWQELWLTCVIKCFADLLGIWLYTGWPLSISPIGH